MLERIRIVGDARWMTHCVIGVQEKTGHLGAIGLLLIAYVPMDGALWTLPLFLIIRDSVAIALTSFLSPSSVPAGLSIMIVTTLIFVMLVYA